MKAKVKKGFAILFLPERGLTCVDDTFIVNFYNKNTYLSFRQKGNHLILHTTEGEVDIVFTGETPNLRYDSFCKDQLILKIRKEV